MYLYIMHNNILYILHCTDLKGDNHWKKLQQQQNSVDQQFDKELDINKEHLGKEELLPLMEMDHRSKEDEVKPFYQYINEELLEITKTENILELLDIDIETNDTKTYQNRRDSFINRELSVVTHLIESVMKASSAQVSCLHNVTS